MAYTKYSLTPANNNATPPDGAPEGMLPSAVNDTMRDMMAQIRDVGDGIRNGTYTMTAPVITGGSITGVALSGNTFTNPVITGGSINNTPIGATTANTGAFTTLSASGAFSANGGATLGDASGDALTINSSAVSIPNGLNFDSNTFVIDATNNRVGIGTASPAQTLDVAGDSQFGTSSTNGARTRYFNQNSQLFVGIDNNAGSNTGIANAPYFLGIGAFPMTFWTNSSERMRITSTGNVGIGTSSPAGRLHLAWTNAGGSQFLTLQTTNSTQGNAMIRWQGSGGTNQAFIGSYAGTSDTGNLEFGNGSTTNMQLSSSGNLGLGVTPSAWNTGVKAMQITSALSMFGNGTNNAVIGNNWFLNTSDQYIYNNSLAASFYRQTSGIHSWHTAPSGTAGNTITFTQAMTLDASGNLGVGSTSPSGKIHSIGNTPLFMNNAAATSEAKFDFVDSGATLRLHNFFGTGSNITFLTNPNGGAVAERMRIDSSGNVGIGGTPTAARTLSLFKSLTGSVTGIQVNATPTIQSDVTSQARIFNSSPSTQAASFTLGNLWHYSATQGTIGATSSITTQIGYYADSTLIGATNNFGFYSDIASGTGRWNFYANGTANNYFAGNVGIGTSSPDSKLHVVSGSVASLRVGYNGTSVNYFDANNHSFRTSSGANIAQMNAFGIGLGATQPSSGMGIAFPATQSASSDANTLDDYEEGTFTPTAIGASTAGTTTYTVQNGYYTKIGRQVNVTLLVAWSALTGTGNLSIQGLPFSIANLSQNYPIGVVTTDGLNWSGGTTIVAEGALNSTNILLWGLVDDGAQVVQQCVNEAASVRVTLTYFTAT